MPKKKNLLEKLQLSFESKSELVLTQAEKRQHERLMFVLELRMINIAITDSDLHKEVLKKYGNDYTISLWQVYQDINIIERFIAHEVNPNADPHKTWIRYQVTEMAKTAYNIALKKEDAYNMTYAATTIGRHHNTDKEDIIRPPFEDIIPFVPEITGDVSVLGIKPMGRLERKALRTKLLKKYGADDLIEIEDAKIVENAEAKK